MNQEGPGWKIAKTKDPWIKISADGYVTVIVPKSEMGQGVSTAIPMIVADELEADLNKLNVGFAQQAKIYVFKWVKA